MAELVFQIRTRSFAAGLVLVDDIVTETAPILRFMKRWSVERVRAYCACYKWTLTVVPPVIETPRCR